MPLNWIKSSLECKPLSVSFLAPGITHSDDFRNGAHSFLFEIEPQRLERVHEHLTLNEPVFFYGGLLAWLTMRLYNEARQTDEVSSLAVEGLALEILAELSRQQKTVSERRPPRWLEQARELLHTQFPETLTHDCIAKSVGVHPVHLATVFRRHYKCTIGEYVRRLRIEFACRKISVSNAPLADITLDAGFSDQSHFSKVFNHLTGMTPARFRANLRTP
ncbi:MAG: helix-turn-helix domain-containing protein [Pyrinomonadaceae bacterium]